MAKTVTKIGKRKTKKSTRSVQKGIISIQSTFNNTIISISDMNGGVICWASAGSSGFKGARKSTPYAAQMAMIGLLDRAKAVGMNEATVTVCGVGSGRESAVRALGNSGIDVVSIKDITPIAHNGVRQKKPRRV